MNTRPARTRPALKWVVVAAGLILVVVFLATWSRPPNPQSRRLEVARHDLGVAIDETLAELTAGFDGTVLTTSHFDACYVGQRNYKVDTGYKHQCSIRTSVLVGHDGDFRTQMLSFDDFLQARSWSGTEWFGQLVNDYWELRAGESPDGVVDIGRLPSPRGVNRDGLWLYLAYASFDNTRDRERMSDQQEARWGFGSLTYEDADLFDMRAVLIRQNFEHLVLFIVEGNYYSHA